MLPKKLTNCHCIFNCTRSDSVRTLL